MKNKYQSRNQDSSRNQDYPRFEDYQMDNERLDRDRSNENNYGEYRQQFNPSNEWNRSSESQQNQTQGEFYGRSPKGYTRSDERIREDVCEALMRQGEIDPSEIEIEVKDGIVTLQGTIESRQAKHRLESKLESILSVKDIENRLQISSSNSPSNVSNLKSKASYSSR